LGAIVLRRVVDEELGGSDGIDFFSLRLSEKTICALNIKNLSGAKVRDKDYGSDLNSNDGLLF
jgi:hypothetical protein